MKRLFTFLLLLFIIVWKAAAAEPQQVITSMDSTRIKLSYTLKYSQMDLKLPEFPLLVHLYNKYHPDSLQVTPEKYKDKLNDFNYRRYYLFSKMIDGQAFVTADCLDEEESGKWHPLKKMLFYGLYSGPTWTLPKNYAAQMASYATEDTFYGPVNVLLNIYVLKEFNWNKLSASERKDVQALENQMAESLYKHFVQNRDWGYFKVYALWAIRINGNPIADKVDIAPLTDYFDRGTWMMRFQQDYQNELLMKREGGAQTTFISNLCTFWLFYLLTESG